MSAPPVDPCVTCGLCCRSYIVPLCSYDVWLISRRQRLAPESFVIAVPQPQLGPEGFQLDQEGPTYGLMLEKQGRLARRQPCVFLLQLAGGHSRCSVYDHRPVVCQAYPMGYQEAAVVQRSEVLCPPDAWPADEPGRPGWRMALQRQRMRFDLYYEIVARWNARAARAPAGLQFAFHEYLSYLLNVQERLAGLDAACEPALLDRVTATWGRLPDAPPEATEIRVAGDELPWVGYLARARAIIDSFYPAIPPLPVLALSRAAAQRTPSLG